jgi:predicted AAA+ superfamily ATPase
MDNDLIRRCILDFYDVGIPEHVTRDVCAPVMKNMVTTIVGGRKTGKTYLTYQIIERLLREGAVTSLKHVCYLHFDDERLLELQAADLRRIDEVFLGLAQASTRDRLVFVFDEIHRIEGWEFFALRLIRNPNWRVIVTGSSADLEEDQVGRQLRGKTLTTRLYPLSFREFSRFCGQEPDRSEFSTSDVARLNHLFEEYMTIGSYPAMRDTERPAHRELLRQYFNSIVSADFLENRHITHPRSCKLFLRNLLRRNSCPYMHKKERNALASMGHPVPANTIADWFNWSRESYVIGVNTINSPSIKKQEQNYRKLYAVDWALANAVSAFREPRTSYVLESIIYWELQRRGLHVNYELVGTDKYEVDFVAGLPGGAPLMAIQVCVDLSDPSTVAREERALTRLVEYLGAGVDPLIITLQDPPAGIAMRYPIKKAWQWCLEQAEDDT